MITFSIIPSCSSSFRMSPSDSWHMKFTSRDNRWTKSTYPFVETVLVHLIQAICTLLTIKLSSRALTELPAWASKWSYLKRASIDTTYGLRTSRQSAILLLVQTIGVHVDQLLAESDKYGNRCWRSRSGTTAITASTLSYLCRIFPNTRNFAPVNSYIVKPSSVVVLAQSNFVNHFTVKVVNTGSVSKFRAKFLQPEIWRSFRNITRIAERDHQTHDQIVSSGFHNSCKLRLWNLREI